MVETKTTKEKDKKQELVKEFNIQEIAENDLNSVFKSIGKGKKVDSGQFRLKNDTSVQKETYIFKDGLLEVVFLDGLAGRITITPKEKFNLMKMIFKEHLKHLDFQFGLLIVAMNMPFISLVLVVLLEMDLMMLQSLTIKDLLITFM